MLQRSLLVLPLIFAVVPHAIAQQALDKIVQDAAVKAKAPGVVVAVIRNNKVEFSTSTGFADLENLVPVTSASVFQIGSMGKQFTATAIMMLVEERRIALDEPISKYVTNLPEGWRQIKIRHLLNHTSGLPEYNSMPGFGTLATTKATHDKWLAFVREAPLQFKPGDDMQYTNTGYYLLGILIETITKEPLRVTLNRLIFDPLEMRSTDLYSHNEIVPKRVRGYIFASDRQQNIGQFDLDWAFAAGAILSTMDDLVRWVNAQGSTKLLKAESWKAIWAPAVLNNGDLSGYGFGWRLATNNGNSVIHHGGKIAGFSAQIARYPDKDLAIIVLTNSFTADAKGIAVKIARHFDPSLEPPGTPTDPIPDPSPKLSAKLESVLKQLLAGSADRNDFEEGFRKDIFSEEGIKGAKDLSSFGAFSTFVLVVASEEKAAKNRVFTFKIGLEDFVADFTIDANLRISRLSISRIR
ncbi:MAG: beta-lactamase family protein [Chlorobia bacterium]|nr:beta-lactamase family protein [Fimbriimonadaceae bacterium]